MPHTFAQDLAAALERQFGARVPVVEVALEIACILAPKPWTGGDPYSGYSSGGRVDLLHFTRPDGVAMTLHLDWLVHETSGQTDRWELACTGFAGTGLEPLLEARGGPHVGNHAWVSVVIG